MTMIRRGVAVGVAAFAGAVLAGCAAGGGIAPTTEPGGDTEVVQIAFFNPVAANAATQANQAGVEAAAEELGAEVTVFDAGFDQAKQISQMEDAIATGRYDAFVVMPVNGAALVGVTEDAVDAGITVVADWNNIGPDLGSIEPQVDGVVTVVAQSMASQGTLLGEATVAACEDIDPCLVVYMPGSFSQGSEQLRLDAALAVTEKHPNITVQTSADGEYSAGPAEAAMTDVLLALPEVDVVVSPGDQMTIGIVQAIDAAGKSDDIAIISAGATKEGIQLVRDGVIQANIVLLPWSEGYHAASYAIKAVRGETVPASVDSSSLSPFGPVATLETLSSPEGADFVGEYSG